MWILVMVFYPLFSVYPQEIIFRAFFFHRYEKLFGNNSWLIISSGLSFGFVHLFFGNWIAVVLSCAGGIFFANTYSKTRSLLIVSMEHSIWGDFIFTIGLGIFFYSGAVS
jgi:membrane protease YdiL (CAAX protease family)